MWMVHVRLTIDELFALAEFHEVAEEETDDGSEDTGENNLICVG